MRIYTRTGDGGETGLFGGGRSRKDDPRVEAYGAVDELNAMVGWTLTSVRDQEIRARLSTFQPDLFALGSHLATPPTPPGRRRPALPPLPGEDRIRELEAWIDAAEAELPELRAFIMPGGAPGGAALHLARTVCRRAERRVVTLAADDEVPGDVIVYLNRLSDLLFVLARLANHRAGEPEEPWRPAGA
ncbi:MAG TPA: cob(I)yrinic acid a,c-diamide adenosyltransferase [Longimicrobiales bacterium]|nr:cob(I)yrinic acid a,c-diamide adenosyltransferase [Longimicrobiales bacterium]